MSNSSTTTLPEGWKLQALKDAADVTMGQSPPGTSYNEIGIGAPFFQGKAEFGDLHPTVRKWTTAGKKFATSGDILMSVRAPVGPTNIADIDCVIGRGLAAIQAKAQVNQTYLLWILRSFEHEIASKGTGTTFDSISGDALRSQTIGVPSLAEQEKIVEILEERLSRLDAALASVRTVREKAVKFRRSLLYAAFSGALTGHDTSPGTLPEGWEMKRLDSIANVQLGRQRSPQHHKGPNMRPYLRAANVTWKGLDVTDVTQMNFTDEEMKTYRLVVGDILVNEASGSASEVGKAVIFRGEIDDCGFQNHLIRVRVKEVGLLYLHHFLVHNAVSGAYVRESQGVGINHLGKAKLAAWPVPVPPLVEQEEIVEILEEQLSRLDASLVAVDAVEKRAAALRRSLLHAAFTGKLTERWREDSHV